MHTELDFLQFMAIAGVLLLAMALSSAQLRRLPISTAAIYLSVGLVLSPLCLDWFKVDLRHDAAWLERTTEIALIVSLFVGGLRLRQPIVSPAWSAVLRLACPLMLCSIGCVALFAYFVLGLAAPHALLLAAVLAPTDPVLASSVSVNQAADQDRVRYGLSGEAGLNDGLAFPFVSLSLAWANGETRAGPLVASLLQALLWAAPVALLVGFLLGRSIGQLAVWLRSHHRDTHAPSDFLAMALIALSYVLAQAMGGLGFLSTFGAGVGLRRAELSVVRQSPHPKARPSASEGSRHADVHPPAEDLVQARVTDEAIGEPAIAAGVLVAETISFGDTAERLLEVALVVLVGVSVASYWRSDALLLALGAFVIVRPALSQLWLLGTPTTPTQRWLLGWFGVRGIGSIYYLSYALNHGVVDGVAVDLASLTLTVVASSIVLHGITAQPLLGYYERMPPAGGTRRPAAPKWRHVTRA
jgi:NhaP-type Na+/H+ or K+/H+ antiporter